MLSECTQLQSNAGFCAPVAEDESLALFEEVVGAIADGEQVRVEGVELEGSDGQFLGPLVGEGPQGQEGAHASLFVLVSRVLVVLEVWQQQQHKHVRSQL